MKVYSIILTAAILLSFFSLSLHAQTITSKSSGGSWEDAGTWIGGVIPGENNDVIIDGTVSVTNSNSSCRNITVNSGKFLQNGGGLGWVYLHVTGKITNNGTIRNNPNGYDFYLEVRGDVINNGNWQQKGTYMPGYGPQNISLAAGKKFESEFYKRDASGYCGTYKLVAKSDLVFTKDFNLQGYNQDGSGTYLGNVDMQDYILNFSNEGKFRNGSVINTGKVYFNNTDAARITFEGNTEIFGTANITDSNVKFKGEVTVEGTLQNGGGLGWVTPVIDGNITNNGIIRNNPEGGELYLQVEGNIFNKGTWQHRGTYIPGHKVQFIKQTEETVFESEFYKRDGSGYCGTYRLTAASDLVFAKDFNLQGYNEDGSGTFRGIFDMHGFGLTQTGKGILHNGSVINAGSLKFLNDAGFFNISYYGNLKIYGNAKISDSNVNMIGDVTVMDTLENGGNLGWVTLSVNGNLINNGVVRNNPSGGDLYIDMNGNISGIGSYINKGIDVNTGGVDRKVSGNYNTNLSLKSTGDPVSGVIKLADNVYNKGIIQIKSGGSAEVSPGAFLYNEGTIKNYGEISNKSVVVTNRVTSGNENFEFYNLNASLSAASGIDSLNAESYGTQVPSTFGNGVKQWWRINQSPDSVLTNFAELSFEYQESNLNGNDESSLQVFHSLDSGKTWKQISTSLNTTRDEGKNTVTITGAPAYGDYVLSSSPNPYSVKPCVIVTPVGRTNIRVGPPNRYTIHYVNNSDVPTEDFLITVSLGTKVHIKQAEIPMDDGSTMVIPVDSIGFDNEDSAAVFLIAGLQPREERQFDLILTADHPFTSQTERAAMFEPFTMIVGAIVVYTGVKVIDYIGDKAKEKVDSWEVLTPEEQKAYNLKIRGQVHDEIQKEKKRGIKVWTARKVGVFVLEKTMGVIGGTVETAAAIFRNVGKVCVSLRSKIWHFVMKDSGFLGVEKTASGGFNPDVSGSAKKMVGVTSWDPNEKVGPGGFGPQQFMSSAGRMNYQILFENKKEATAPAYKIVIVDTLRPEFDPSTVEFGRTSHPGFTMTRNENILIWEVEGIELPPNVNPPEGEGWVSFSVRTKDNLPSGTILRNTATIVFDVNKPITTNEVVNTLDFEPPVTVMDNSIEKTGADTLLVKWNSTEPDGGSGVGTTTLYCSVDGGMYEPVAITVANSAKYGLIPGNHNYKFYALAVDNVGNTEVNIPEAVGISAVTSVGGEQLPADYAVYQNYPNPFNPVTKIKFSLKADAKVTLKIYNILGELVADLIHKNMRAGNHSIDFNGADLASGMYLYRVEISGNDGKKISSVKKMILLK